MDEMLKNLDGDLKGKCLELYKDKHYKECVNAAFDIVRSKYKEEFKAETVPKGFLESFHVKNNQKTEIDGTGADKDFQKGCEHILRSISKFRNFVVHAHFEKDMSNCVALHYLYVSSLALNILSNMESCPIKGQHPFSKDDYKNKKLKYTITFDYTDNNSCYDIGNGIDTFTIKVTGCGDNSLYLYSSPDNIRKIGLIKREVADLASIDFDDIKKEANVSSEYRTIQLNNVGVLINDKNRFAVLKLKKATRQSPFIAEIEYRIMGAITQ